MPLHTEAFTQRRLTYSRLYTQKLFDTDGFSDNHRSFDTEKPLHRESFTHRSFYTRKLFHRNFYAEKLLRTGAFTHRRLYTQKLVRTEAFYGQKLLHREAFTHRRFPTEKPIPQSSFNTLQKIAILRKFWTFGHHIARKGCIRRWKIAIFDIGQ